MQGPPPDDKRLPTGTPGLNNDYRMRLVLASMKAEIAVRGGNGGYCMLI